MWCFILRLGKTRNWGAKCSGKYMLWNNSDLLVIFEQKHSQEAIRWSFLLKWAWSVRQLENLNSSWEQFTFTDIAWRRMTNSKMDFWYDFGQQFSFLDTQLLAMLWSCSTTRVLFLQWKKQKRNQFTIKLFVWCLVLNSLLKYLKKPAPRENTT